MREGEEGVLNIQEQQTLLFVQLLCWTNFSCNGQTKMFQLFPILSGGDIPLRKYESGRDNLFERGGMREGRGSK